MKAHVYKSLCSGLYHATLLGGEFDNCHGQGPTPEHALTSLKLVVRIRQKQAHTNEALKAKHDDRQMPCM